MGIVLDTVYSFMSGRIAELDCNRITGLISKLGFELTHPQMQVDNDTSPLIAGLNEFREHLGGQLTIMLLKKIGEGEEVHELDTALLKKSTEWINKNRMAWKLNMGS